MGGQTFWEGRGSVDAHPQMLCKYASVALLGGGARRNRVKYRLETTSCDLYYRSLGITSVSQTPGSPMEHHASVFK